MKTCVTCKHYAAFRSNLSDRCYRPLVGKASLVTGLPRSDYPKICSLERTLKWGIDRLFGVCGESGRYWEEKQ